MASYRTITVGATIAPAIVPVNASVVTNIQTSTFPTYEGGYVFTPTQEIQTVETENFVLLENITINPIPSNYGLITWNGSVLTVS